ncbi:MAG TPA: BrnT family toxin [Gemmatimonadales bacterium]|nr:BrnT family toxin [Gemmatimonadales bacterium]
MRFSWDPKKSAANLRTRGFDFGFATAIFDGPTVERIDNRRSYGEVRVIAIGVVEGLRLTVVYTDRGGPEPGRRIIAAWRSNRRERQTYAQGIEGRGGASPGKG